MSRQWNTGSSQFEGRPELVAAQEFVHFGCTSEETINNTSHGLQLKEVGAIRCCCPS